MVSVQMDSSKADLNFIGYAHVSIFGVYIYYLNQAYTMAEYLAIW